MKTFLNSKKLMLSVAAAAFTAVGVFGGDAAAQQTIKMGMSAPKTGPLAGGATVTHWPNVKLWVHDVNSRGGLKLKNGRAKVEVIEYDDRTNPGEAIKNINRLATQDKVDFILAPFGTGFNLATAPIFNKLGYPQLAVSAITDKIPTLTKRYDNIFFMLGSTSTFTGSVVKILKKMRSDGKIGNRVAMVNVADAFGIELAAAARPVFKEAGFEIVYDKSYPLGAKDLSPIVKGAKASNPDAFVAWSYPPDTFALTAQARINKLDVKAYYTAVATPFPSFKGKFKDAAEGILGAGGINPDTPELKAYFKRHKEVTGKDADYWASAVTYASFEVLGQAIEGVGSIDRKAVTEYIKQHEFKTVIGPVKFVNQNSERFWTVGQWQGNKFYGVSSEGRPGARPVIDKPDWK
ncbi:MAG: amino acid ABC transporter substrate-binding protein [Rhodospirillales bacterium]|nr:amino acid ABC transporter substrate-binding protein [Rhodospirillales bacterium]